MFSYFVKYCISLQDWYIFPNSMSPWADGHYLPDHPAQLVLEGRHAKVDIISGINRDDGAIFALRNYRIRCLVS